MANPYKQLASVDSFIADYMDHVSHLETPIEYDFWCAVWLVSLAVGRSVIVRPTIPVYLNEYILLVSESGTTRKSTAVKSATQVARMFIQQLEGFNHHIELIETKMSPEELEVRAHNLTKEHGYAQIAVSVSELVRFLGRDSYNLALPGLLTDFYDSPEMQTGGGTIKRGRTVIERLFLSFLSASTPSWLQRAVNPDVIEGGFTSRILPIHAERRKQRVSWPNKTGGADRAKQLASNLLGIYLAAREITTGTIDLDDNAFSVFDRWYRGRQEHKDAYRASFEAREDDHILRLAALLSASDNSWRISKGAIQKAIAIIAEVKRAGYNLFTSVGVKDDLSIGVERLRGILLEHGKSPISQTELHKRVRKYFDREDFNLALHIMKELELIQMFENPEQTGPGRRATYWRGTSNLLSANIEEAVKREFARRSKL